MRPRARYVVRYKILRDISSKYVFLVSSTETEFIDSLQTNTVSQYDLLVSIIVAYTDYLRFRDPYHHYIYVAYTQ